MAEPLDTSDRWIVRDFYNFVFPYGTDADMGWTGTYDGNNSTAGTVSAEWLDATRMRVNFYRHMAGITPNITFSAAKNAASQDSALIISDTGVLNHNPQPADSVFWTADGQEAASKGNIAIGSTGPGAVDGYMIDFGGSNNLVGHRRWIFYPRADIMGSGDVPGNGVDFVAANTLWVHPADVFGVRPGTRDFYVAWPSPGYVPSELVWSRWSFTYPNADFASATITMTGPGGAIPLVVDYRTTGGLVNAAPESTIVWVPNSMATNKRVNWPTPMTDEQIDVTISGVTVNNQPVGPFNYSVTIFDAASAGNAEHATVLTDPGTVTVHEAANFDATTRSWSDGVQARTFHTVAYSQVYDAESGLGDLIVQTNGDYDEILNNRDGNLTNVYRLAHTQPKAQILELPQIFLVGDSSPELDFLSSLSFATVHQQTSVDVNIGDGYSWQTVWKSNHQADIEFVDTFTPVNIDLSSFSGQTIRIRFRYDYTGSVGDGYYGASNYYVGWAIDDITLTGVEEVTDVYELPVEWGQDFITATFTSTTPTYMQARDIAFTEMDGNGFALDWGPALLVTPAADGFTLVGTPVGQWTDNPTVSYVYGQDTDWVYSHYLGWLYVPNGSWMYSGIGWIKYVSGSITEGLWLYHTTEGFIYVQAGYPGLFLRSPFAIAGENWGSFNP